MDHQDDQNFDISKKFEKFYFKEYLEILEKSDKFLKENDADFMNVFNMNVFNQIYKKSFLEDFDFYKNSFEKIKSDKILSNFVKKFFSDQNLFELFLNLDYYQEIIDFNQLLDISDKIAKIDRETFKIFLRKFENFGEEKQFIFNQFFKVLQENSKNFIEKINSTFSDEKKLETYDHKDIIATLHLLSIFHNPENLKIDLLLKNLKNGLLTVKEKSNIIFIFLRFVLFIIKNRLLNLKQNRLLNLKQILI